jgi:hypothetical protein
LLTYNEKDHEKRSLEFVYFRVSERQIYVFKVDNLNTPLNTVGLDVSPAILMPYYDEDSSTLFLTGRVRIFCN